MKERPYKMSYKTCIQIENIYFFKHVEYKLKGPK